ncbi:uncharacterized protein LOC120279896 [Dioscorea cayenensis subsp. rotundata]|uniref:Uncharacterized protein LOC120279896 n=1 Tax=Dioscorea cayennensis subsp. rotundata TaxID=55577 RepID=A0AB40CRS8_DIOCR|nr:uncharacterized protein LOC120279896 [Dioscorea cayenensis subsp. rotundata]XP_039142625.1 uncharacterized protein LOC120279896 [Dioscorea cayenensis subsp. rotundata]XP_039142701.1 uncharacterized protein LOC120279896 [Dioscorea cayenensis subsp. rotundata]XP_039142781.1 uncharacterized protein LOC120279896 [Dioscorea cayenensis subsp. rotundata]
MDKMGNVVLDLENPTQPSDKCCSGSPKMTRVLSRKFSCRMERQNGEEQEADETIKKLVVNVVPSQLELLKQPSMLNKGMTPLNSPCLPEAGDGRHRRFNRFTIHPNKILLFLATVSSMGTMILIYFTLAIYLRGEE